MNTGRPFNELSHSGVLWAINRCLFHPRGFALALHFEMVCPRCRVKRKDFEGGEHLSTCPDCGSEAEPVMDGPPTGWSILGNGGEVWTFKEEDDDEGFARFEALLRELMTKEV